MKQLIRYVTLTGIVRTIAAVILAQTLFFKFTAAPESVYIFSTLGVEPWGRIAAGLMELMAVILLLGNRTAWLGALLAMGLMFGAIGAHLTRLGIEVQDDKGLLFGLACTVLAASTFIAAGSPVVRGYMRRLMPEARTVERAARG